MCGVRIGDKISDSVAPQFLCRFVDEDIFVFSLHSEIRTGNTTCEVKLLISSQINHLCYALSSEYYTLGSSENNTTFENQ